MSHGGRFIYAQCMAGFTDCVGVLIQMIEVAKRSRRTVVFDTRHDKPEGYGVDFWDTFCFEPESPLLRHVIAGGSKGVHEIINRAQRSVYPEKIGWNGLLDYMRGAHTMFWNGKGWCDSKTKINMQFNTTFLRKASDPRDSTGVYITSSYAPTTQEVPSFLPLLHPCPMVMERYKWARSQLPKSGYISIHVRDTDIRADTASLLKRYGHVLRRVSGAIHLATDNPKTIKTLSAAGISVHNFTNFGGDGDSQCKNLHSDSAIPGTCRLHDAIVDLMLIGESKGLVSNSQGGFTRLARNFQSKRTSFGTGRAWMNEKKENTDNHDVTSSFM